jgi:glycosyltransferase involved in cell wall biosynthesis
MRNASIVVAANDIIADHARQTGARRVEIVPSVIDLDRYAATPAAPGPKRPIVVGWIGIPLNAHYLTAIAPALKKLIQDGVIRLQLVGTQAPTEFAGCPVETFPWSEDSEVERVSAFDVGIMPLDDEPWERGKSAYKLLQVMAAGKPVVASPVGANRNVVNDGVNGLLATTPDQWIAALSRLADDATLRHRMGLEARRTVSERYSLAGALPRMAAILDDAIAQAARRSIAR